MANEITVNMSLSVRKGAFDYVTRPASFRDNQTGIGGPSPGSFTATVAGADIDFSRLTIPKWCRITNLDTSNSIAVGIWNADQSEFYPVMRIEPGHSNTLSLHPDLNEEYAGAGTGTTGELNTLRVKAENAPCLVLCEAFES